MLICLAIVFFLDSMKYENSHYQDEADKREDIFKEVRTSW